MESDDIFLSVGGCLIVRGSGERECEFGDNLLKWLFGFKLTSGECFY